MLETIGDLARIATALIAGLIAWLVFSYNKRKDKQEYFRLANSEIQELNRFVLSNDKTLAAADQLISGSTMPYNDGDARKRFISFMILNRLENMWMASEQNLIDKQIAKHEIEAMSYIMKNNERLFRDIVSQGYSKKFVDMIDKYFIRQ